MTTSTLVTYFGRAGSGTSEVRNGSMDGAIRSGRRAVAEIPASTS